MFPAGFRALGLGKVIGTPTMGAVIGTGSYSLIDGSTVRTPGVGVFLADRKRTNMENYGVQPDILVENTPEDNLAGRDRQTRNRRSGADEADLSQDVHSLVAERGSSARRLAAALSLSAASSPAPTWRSPRAATATAFDRARGMPGRRCPQRPALPPSHPASGS